MAAWPEWGVDKIHNTPRRLVGAPRRDVTLTDVRRTVSVMTYCTCIRTSLSRIHEVIELSALIQSITVHTVLY